MRSKPKAGVGDYTEDQSEFLRATVDYRTKTGRSVLRATDYLRIVQGMGYRREKPPNRTHKDAKYC